MTFTTNKKAVIALLRVERRECAVYQYRTTLYLPQLEESNRPDINADLPPKIFIGGRIIMSLATRPSER